MSSLQWNTAARRVAGAISLGSQPDAIAAARDAISETLQDWDTRRDWRYTQVVAPNIALAAGATTFDLPTTFKKPYVAYLTEPKVVLWYIERANWHRLFPGSTTASTPGYYTLFNDATTGKGDIFAPTAAAATLVVLYYKAILYTDSDDAALDIPARWEGYILAGARMRLIASKVASEKALFWEKQYEQGVKRAKEDDLRLPDQFISFQPPESMNTPPWWNPNSTWQAQWGE
jgi:hypothetical protein